LPGHRRTILYLPGSGWYDTRDRLLDHSIPAGGEVRRHRRGGEMRLILVVVALCVYWLALSGHYELWFVASGVFLTLAVVAFCWVKGIIDAEGFPIGLLSRALFYWPWLALQIVKSGLRVTRVILHPSLPITPTLVRVDALQRTAVGLTTYANSITLTPGTLTVEATERGHTLWVHALEREGAEGFADDEMNRKVAWFEQARA
jgi:multicomponent Na+:H+ antiporter subunit E